MGKTIAENDVGTLDGLMARIRSGDRAALSELQRRYGNAVYREALMVLHDETCARRVVENTFREMAGRLAADPGSEGWRMWLSAVAARNIGAYRPDADDARRIGRDIGTQRFRGAAVGETPAQNAGKPMEELRNADGHSAEPQSAVGSDAGAQGATDDPKPIQKISEGMAGSYMQAVGYGENLARPPHMRGRTVAQARPIVTPAAVRRAEQAQADRAVPAGGSNAPSPMEQYLTGAAVRETEVRGGKEPSAPQPEASPEPCGASAAAAERNVRPPDVCETSADAAPMSAAQDAFAAPKPAARKPQAAPLSRADAAPLPAQGAADTGGAKPTRAKPAHARKRHAADPSQIMLYTLTALLGVILLWFAVGILSGRGVLHVPDLGFRWFNANIVWLF